MPVMKDDHRESCSSASLGERPCYADVKANEAEFSKSIRDHIRMLCALKAGNEVLGHVFLAGLRSFSGPAFPDVLLLILYHSMLQVHNFLKRITV